MKNIIIIFFFALINQAATQTNYFSGIIDYKVNDTIVIANEFDENRYDVLFLSESMAKKWSHVLQPGMYVNGTTNDNETSCIFSIKRIILMIPLYEEVNELVVGTTSLGDAVIINPNSMTADIYSKTNETTKPDFILTGTKLVEINKIYFLYKGNIFIARIDTKTGEASWCQTGCSEE